MKFLLLQLFVVCIIFNSNERSILVVATGPGKIDKENEQEITKKFLNKADDVAAKLEHTLQTNAQKTNVELAQKTQQYRENVEAKIQEKLKMTENQKNLCSCLLQIFFTEMTRSKDSSKKQDRFMTQLSYIVQFLAMLERTDVTFEKKIHFFVTKILNVQETEYLKAKTQLLKLQSPETRETIIRGMVRLIVLNGVYAKTKVSIKFVKRNKYWFIPLFWCSMFGALEFLKHDNGYSIFGGKATAFDDVLEDDFIELTQDVVTDTGLELPEGEILQVLSIDEDGYLIVNTFDMAWEEDDAISPKYSDAILVITDEFLS